MRCKLWRRSLLRVVLLATGLSVARPADAQWRTREVTACTDAHPSVSSCAKAAISVQARPSSTGTDVKVWIANLQGAPSVSAIDNAVFSSLFFVTFEFRSSYGTSYDSTTTTALTPEGGARVLGPSRTWARLLPGAFTLYTLGGTVGTDAGIGGCEAGESSVGYPLFTNAYSTCGDGSWLTYSFSTSALWSVDGIMMMDFAFGSVYDDGATTSGSQMCYSDRFNMVPPDSCNIRSDATYDGLPDVAVIVPEPGTGMLVTAGMAGLWIVMRRRTRRN